MLQGIDALRADFAAQAGGTTVYFGAESDVLGAPAKAALGAAGGLAAPSSGSRGPDRRIWRFGSTRAIMRSRSALAAPRRPASYLVLLGVPAAQVSTTSWGKERPGLGRAVTVLVR